MDKDIKKMYRQNYSLPQIVRYIENQHKVKRSVGFVSGRLKRMGIKLRSISEASRTLDYNKILLDKKSASWIDGFLLGDGNISINEKTKVGRASCNVLFKEFSEYMMRGLKVYNPIYPRFYEPNQKQKEKGGKGVYGSCTKSHPDFYKQYQRWYFEGNKIVPNNININPISVLLWYLGDGTVIINNDANTIILRLSTDCFKKEQIEDILVKKLKQLGIDCYRNNDNRINISAKGIPAFFKLIGKKSPVKCYDYKFNLPGWRFQSKRMKTVSEELDINYNHLSYLVKIGKVPCYRVSEKGRPRFLLEHVEIIESMIKRGELKCK